MKRHALHLLASLLAVVPAAADIRFHSAPAYSAGDRSVNDAVIGDFNGDGSNDVALTSGDDASGLLVMLGTPDGRLIAGPARR